jgi:PHD/YefM family antitoxin component YafN of YafNO toxin-antitoxin module
MKVASVAEVEADFAGFIKATQKAPVVVTHNGKPIAILIKAQDPGELERTLMGHSPRLQAILEAARKRFRAGRGIAHEKFWQQIEGDNARRKPKQSRTGKNSRSKRV